MMPELTDENANEERFFVSSTFCQTTIYIIVIFHFAVDDYCGLGGVFARVRYFATKYDFNFF